MGHALMENRSGLIVAATLTKAAGTVERAAAETMIVHHSPGVRRLTLGADKGYMTSRSLFTLRHTRLSVSLPAAPANRAPSARRTRRVLVPAR